MKHQDLIDKLKTSDVTVKFTKKDDSIRIMKCTLNESKFPVGSKSASNDDASDIITVFDLEKQDWRKINLNSVISY